MLLIRDPAEVVSSYLRSRASVAADDIGILQQLELQVQLGPSVPVIDSADFLRAPELYLRWLCDYAGVPFTEAMLSWPAGPRASDGVWAPYWYDAVLRLHGLRALPPAPGRADARGRGRGRRDPAGVRAPVRRPPRARLSYGRA